MTGKTIEEKCPQKTTKGDGKSSGQKGAGKVEHSFSKQQILSSGRFRDRRDIVEALLDEKEGYTVEAVEEKIENYMKGKVK